MKQRPPKVWLIIGHHPARVLKDPAYSTDPRDYDLPDFDPMTDTEYREVANRVRVFQVADDAIDFCYECGLEVTFIHGFRLVRDKYEADQGVTDEVADTDW